jgi:hypothetical protein
MSSEADQKRPSRLAQGNLAALPDSRQQSRWAPTQMHRSSGRPACRLAISWMRLALCASLVTLLPKTVAAAEIDKIELTQDGPKTLLPLRRPFYLTLEPSADVKAAQIVFVRYAFRPFGHHPSRTTCSEVQAALSNVAKGSAAQQVLPAGFQRISAIWETPVEATNDPRARMYKRLKDYGRALVLDAQTITEDKKKLAFLVHSPGFFVDGAAYCMFVYERRSSTLSNELYKSILDATYGQVEDLATPLTAGQSSAANPVPPALSGKVFQAFLADQNLKNLLSKEVLDEVSKRAQGKPTDKEPLKTLMDEVIQGPLTRAWKIAWTGQTIREKIKAWAGALWKEDLPGIGEELIIAHDSLAITLAELLAHHGHLDVKRENGSTSFSLNGKSYDRIRVIGDFSELELIATPTTQPANTAPGRRATAPANVPAAAVPEKHRLKGVSPLDLPLPESTSTLRDMVELTRGALRVGDRYLRGAARNTNKEVRLLPKILRFIPHAQFPTDEPTDAYPCQVPAIRRISVDSAACASAAYTRQAHLLLPGALWQNLQAHEACEGRTDRKLHPRSANWLSNIPRELPPAQSAAGGRGDGLPEPTSEHSAPRQVPQGYSDPGVQQGVECYPEGMSLQRRPLLDKCARTIWRRIVGL